MEKMICSILMIINLISRASGTFVVNLTQTSYQAEENQDITLEWTFTTRPDISLDRLFVFCQLIAELRHPVLFHLHEGVELSESQDKHFAGRVQFDKDVLRDGRLRLNVSRLRTNDSGLYRCDVHTGNGSGAGKCQLSVTAAGDEQKPQRPIMIPGPESRGRIGLYAGLGLPATVLLLVVCGKICIALKEVLRPAPKSKDFVSLDQENPRKLGSDPSPDRTCNTTAGTGTRSSSMNLQAAAGDPERGCMSGLQQVQKSTCHSITHVSELAPSCSLHQIRHPRLQNSNLHSSCLLVHKPYRSLRSSSERCLAPPLLQGPTSQTRVFSSVVPPNSI